MCVKVYPDFAVTSTTPHTPHPYCIINCVSFFFYMGREGSYFGRIVLFPQPLWTTKGQDVNGWGCYYNYYHHFGITRIENYDSSPHKRDNTAVPNWVGPTKVVFLKNSADYVLFSYVLNLLLSFINAKSRASKFSSKKIIKFWNCQTPVISDKLLFNHTKKLYLSRKTDVKFSHTLIAIHTY